MVGWRSVDTEGDNGRIDLGNGLDVPPTLEDLPIQGDAVLSREIAEKPDCLICSL